MDRNFKYAFVAGLLALIAAPMVARFLPAPTTTTTT